jgi:hypothetical protein
MFRLVIFASLLFAPFCNSWEETPHSTYQYDFAVCAIFQDEAPYLREWIEYHKIVGAQHFYLYNHESRDNYLEVLTPYLCDGSVELVDWSAPNFVSYGQKRAYMDAIDKAMGKVKWLAVIDLDEFLVPKSHDTIPAFLAEFDKIGIGGVCVNWQMFGTSFVSSIKQGELLIEKLTLKAVKDHNENRHVKSIIRPEHVVEPPHIHHFEYEMGYCQVNAKRELFLGPRTPYVCTDKIQINHYWTKDETFLTTVKIPRRKKWGESIESINRRLLSLNRVKDESILRFLPQLREKILQKS